MKRVVMVVGMLCAASSAFSAEKADSPNGKRSPASRPVDVLKQMERAFETKSLELYAKSLTADYRFHTSDTNLAANKYFTGFGREHELESVNTMFNGYVKDGKLVQPPFERIRVSFEVLSDNADPEHADSTGHYRLLTCRSTFQFITAEDDTLWDSPGLHAMHLVRGDAALLSDGQRGGSQEWYLRRWLENVGAVETHLASHQGDCGESAAAAANLTPGPGVLAVRALSNPACPALEIMCDVPGTEPVHVDVFDVTGRLANQREIAVTNAGALRVEAGSGANLSPGVYWVRLRQAKLKPSTQMVVVAK